MVQSLFPHFDFRKKKKKQNTISKHTFIINRNVFTIRIYNNSIGNVYCV